MENFDAWMKEVDKRCEKRFGLSIHDLPDMNFMSAFEDEYTPAEFVAEIDESDLF